MTSPTPLERQRTSVAMAQAALLHEDVLLVQLATDAQQTDEHMAAALVSGANVTVAALLVYERAVGVLLSKPGALAIAARLAAEGRPLTPAQCGLDAPTVMTAVGVAAIQA